MTELTSEEKAQKEREDGEIWTWNEKLVEEAAARKKAELDELFKPTQLRNIKSKVARKFLSALVWAMQQREPRIAELQQKYGFDIPKIFLIRLKDERVGLLVCFQNGRVRVLDSGRSDVTITTILPVLRDLRRGVIDTKQQDGTVVPERYDPRDAWARGEIEVEGSNPEEGEIGWLSYLLLLGEVLESLRGGEP